MNSQIRQELLAIKGDDELLLVDNVIEWARQHKSSALHKQYQWDLKKAALEHWRDTTRNLIAIHIRYENGERSTVSLTIDRSRPGGGYRNVDDVMQAPPLLEIMLADALRELERMRSKYERVKALAPVWEEADKLRRKQKGGEKRVAA